MRPALLRRSEAKKRALVAHGLVDGLVPQVLMAVVMTKHRGVLAVLKEVALVLLCLKPGCDV